MFADVDNGDNTLQKKIRNGEISRYNFILGMIHFSHAGCAQSEVVVGQEELDAQSVNIRNRDDVGTKSKGAMMPLDEVINKLLELKTSRRLQNKLV